MTDDEIASIGRRAQTLAASVAAGDVPALPGETVEQMLLAAYADVQRLVAHILGEPPTLIRTTTTTSPRSWGLLP